MKKMFWIIVAVVLQLIVLGSIITKYEYTYKYGHEVKVKTQLYDPRDLFRGEYVYITYDINTYTGTNYDTGICNDEKPYTDTLYVLPIFSGEYAVGIQGIQKQKPSSGVFFAATRDYCMLRDCCTYEYPLSGDEKDYSRPITVPVKEGKCRLSTIDANYCSYQSIRLDYGADKFFVKEGSGRYVEDLIRTGIVYATWKLSKGGDALLYNLLFDGKELK